MSTHKLLLLGFNVLFKIASSFSLDAVDPNAYDAFKASRNLGDVIERVLRNQQEASNGSGPRKLLTVEASLMTPVQPMLVSVAAHKIKLYRGTERGGRSLQGFFFLRMGG